MLLNVATLAHILRFFLASQGEYVEAEPLLARATAIWEKVLGSEHVDVAIALTNSAEILREQVRPSGNASMFGWGFDTIARRLFQRPSGIVINTGDSHEIGCHVRADQDAAFVADHLPIPTPSCHRTLGGNSPYVAKLTEGETLYYRYEI